MASSSVRAWLAEHAPGARIIDGHASTATVADAAEALGAEPGRIAKSLCIRVNGEVLLLVTRGDARLDNGKCKAAFGGRPRMLGPEETLDVTGHPVGGVCPFGLKSQLRIFCDISLRSFDCVFPAGGTRTSSVAMGPAQLAELTGAGWVDVCVLPA